MGHLVHGVNSLDWNGVDLFCVHHGFYLSVSYLLGGFFPRGNNDSLSVGMCTGYILEMTVVMMFSLGGNSYTVYLFSFQICTILNAMLISERDSILIKLFNDNQILFYIPTPL